MVFSSDVDHECRSYGGPFLLVNGAVAHLM
jgi:hypothetical protein